MRNGAATEGVGGEWISIQRAILSPGAQLSLWWPEIAYVLKPNGSTHTRIMAARQRISGAGRCRWTCSSLVWCCGRLLGRSCSGMAPLSGALLLLCNSWRVRGQPTHAHAHVHVHVHGHLHSHVHVLVHVHVHVHVQLIELAGRLIDVVCVLEQIIACSIPM